MSKVIWSDETVAALKEYQESGVFHPYTCGNDSRHRELEPTKFGWKCLDCDYTQNWFHSASADLENTRRVKQALSNHGTAERAGE